MAPYSSCVVCGHAIDGEPVLALQADVPSNYHIDPATGDTIPSLLHKKCFDAQRRVNVREWLLPEQVEDHMSEVDRRADGPDPGQEQVRVLVEYEVERWREFS